MTLRKTYTLVDFKALPDQPGGFTAVVSVFGNVDLQGDRVVKGAFTKSLQKWKQQGDPIPIIWSHDWGDPFAHIGKADPRLAEEIDVGLKLVGTFDVHKPFAAQVYDLVKENRVREWSFAYDVEKENKASDGANELQVLDLIEAGPTLKGANPDTFTLGVKSALEHAAAAGSSTLTLNEARALMDLPPLPDAKGRELLVPRNVFPLKAGRILSAKNESTIRQARDLIDQVLTSLDKAPEEEKAVSDWLDAETAHQDASRASESPSEAPDGWKVAEGSWDGAASRYTDSEWQRAAAACRGTDAPPKTDCFLPHHEPGGEVSRAGVHAAAARFNQVQAPPQAKSKARTHLAGHYRNDLDEDVPDVLGKSDASLYADKLNSLLADIAI